jgi:hypothetical protein
MRTRRRPSRVQHLALIAFTLIAVHACAALAAEPELPTTVTILDPDIYLYGLPYPSISPDGNWIAYVSKGFVCVCNVGSPPRRRIHEVPNSYTWTHLSVRDGDTTKTGTFESLSRGLNREQRDELHEQISRYTAGFNWMQNSSGFIFGIQAHNAAKKQATFDTYFASVAGEVINLAHISPDTYIRAIYSGILTPDRKFLVSPVEAASSDRYRPLIWNVKKNKPRATPFLYLTPSKTSGRWLGIEKDTKQLVITDENFEIIKRFAETIPEPSYGVRIDWSPDERFIIWRNAIGFDHFSNWEGFRLNLESGEKRKIEGRFMDEQFGFTGRSGEFFRCGQTGMETRGYDAVVGAHLTLIPDGNGPESHLWRISVDPNGPRPGMLTNRPGNPPVRMRPDANLFAIAIPRPAGQTSGAIWHLINREGKKWRFPGRDNGHYISPYEVAGFADNGKKIVAYDSTRLFTLPVATIMVAENQAK